MQTPTHYIIRLSFPWALAGKISISFPLTSKGRGLRVFGDYVQLLPDACKMMEASSLFESCPVESSLNLPQDVNFSQAEVKQSDAGIEVCLPRVFESPSPLAVSHFSAGKLNLAPSV